MDRDQLEPGSDSEEKDLARYKDAVCRLCRREGMKLYLKGDRCFKDKCAIERRQYAPGQHGKRRSKVQGYGIQLREKQKVKRIYGVLEKQFRRYFRMAERSRGITGEVLLQTLERRLDNVVYRIGFAPSRPMARQLVAHGHFLVNGKNVHVPSFLVKATDVVSLKDRSRKNDSIKASLATASGRGIPAWLIQDAEKFQGTVVGLPARVDIPLPITEQLIVELYSK